MLVAYLASMPRSYRELKVWEASMEIATSTYQLTAGFPADERYGLTSQMRRAAVSISSNIAEGSGRETRRDFRNFVLIARGSTCELESQIELALRLGYCEKADAAALEQLCSRVGRMLNGLSKFLKANAAATPPTSLN